MNTKRRFRLTALLLTLVVLMSLHLSALAEGEDAPLAVTLTGLDGSLTVNQTLTITASVEGLPDDVVPSFVWSCDPMDSVEFEDATSTPQIKLLKAGNIKISVTVTASIDSVEKKGGAQQSVTVSEPSATYVTVTPDNLTLEKNEVKPLTAAVEPSGAARSVWSSDKEDVAVVDQDGNVTAKAVGAATITARSGDKSDFCSVEVSGLTLSAPESMVEGNSQTLTATPYGAAKGLPLTWTSSNEAAVRTQGGKLTAMSVGEAVVTVSASDNKYSASRTVKVTANTAGVISVSADAGHPLSFSSLKNQLQDRCQSVLSASLDHVSGLSVPTDTGILFHKYVSADDPGFGVGSLENYYIDSDYQKLLSDITFVPSGSFSGTAEISYTGYTSDGRSFKGSIQVSVEAARDVVYSTSSNSTVSFSAGDFNTVCRSRTSRDMSYVTFTLPSESRGVLYYKYASGSTYNTKVDESTRYGRTSVPYLSDITFAPAEGYSGSFTIPYTCYDTSGYSFGGRVSVTVSKGGAVGGGGDVNYSTAKNKAVTFRASDFNTACRSATGRTLERVSFELPSSSRGTLYYNYTSNRDYDSEVEDGDRFYRSGSPGISKVTFVPASGFDGAVSFSFTGWDEDDTRFTGTVEITVGSGDSGDVTYSTAKNTAVDFSAADFSAVCRDVTGSALERVRFSLPSVNQGRLYYDYTGSGHYDSKVSESTSYYRTGSPSLSKVTFVPAEQYDGTATIDFTGWSEDGERFDGTVTITVGSGSSKGSVSYSTSQNSAVAFKASDFNEVSQDATGKALDYVRFELPSASRGTLYTNYSSRTGTGTRVSDSAKYYRSGSPALSSITFAPADGYTGKVSIGFTGYDVNGAKLTGTVEIDVGGGGSAVLTYRVASGKSLALDDADFSDLCREQVGGTLRYVRFTLPSSTSGTLYYRYTGDPSDTKVSASTSYYKSGDPYLSRVSFVPAAGYTGPVTIPFTGYNTSGDKFTGSLNVTVEPGPVASVIRYSSGGTAVSFHPQDFENACNARLAGAFSSVRFTLPTTAYGRLYYGLTTPSQYDGMVNASVSYSRGGSNDLSKVSFLPSAGFSGTAVLTYTGTDADGASYEGTVEITVTPPAVSSHFSDLGACAWAVPSVDFLQEYGMVSGSGSGRFTPGGVMTRGDFVLVLYRTFQFEGGSTEPFSDVPVGSYYYESITAAKSLNIVQGDAGGRFYPSAPLTRQDTAVLLQLSMRAVGWSIPDGSSAVLSAYPDSGDVSPYAVGAVSSMVQLGVIHGDDYGRLNPKATLTRAEMAVILHRVLTR